MPDVVRNPHLPRAPSDAQGKICAGLGIASGADIGRIMPAYAPAYPRRLLSDSDGCYKKLKSGGGIAGEQT
jgi:hypothetical protein